MASIIVCSVVHKEFLITTVLSAANTDYTRYAERFSADL